LGTKMKKGACKQGWIKGLGNKGRNFGTRVGEKAPDSKGGAGRWETMVDRQPCEQGYRRGKCNIETTTIWNRRHTSEKVLSSSGTGLCMVMMMMLVRLKLA
jgi:hypothetical protein